MKLLNRRPINIDTQPPLGTLVRLAAKKKMSTMKKTKNGKIFQIANFQTNLIIAM